MDLAGGWRGEDLSFEGMAAGHFRFPAEAPKEKLSVARVRKQTGEGFRLTWRTIKLVWRSSPAATSVLAALTLVSAVLPLGVAYAGKGIVDGGRRDARAHRRCAGSSSSSASWPGRR